MNEVTMKQTLKTNINVIQETIENHLPAGNKEPTVVAVTKTVDEKTMRDLHALGVKHFGENRPDVFLKKYENLADINDEIQWHFIGNLQTRQVKKIINDIDYLHSLDRLSLAKEIQKRAEQPVNCFIQVNVSGEDSKSGFQPDALADTLKELEAYDKLNIIGLMTMAPIDASQEEIHEYFRFLKELQVEVEQSNFTNAPCTEVSMGMSQDYPIAVSEGATFIRVGTAFFKDAL